MFEIDEIGFSVQDSKNVQQNQNQGMQQNNYNQAPQQQYQQNTYQQPAQQQYHQQPAQGGFAMFDEGESPF